MPSCGSPAENWTSAQGPHLHVPATIARRATRRCFGRARARLRTREAAPPATQGRRRLGPSRRSRSHSWPRRHRAAARLRAAERNQPRSAGDSETARTAPGGGGVVCLPHRPLSDAGRSLMRRAATVAPRLYVAESAPTDQLTRLARFHQWARAARAQRPRRKPGVAQQARTAGPAG